MNRKSMDRNPDQIVDTTRRTFLVAGGAAALSMSSLTFMNPANGESSAVRSLLNSALSPTSEMRSEFRPTPTFSIEPVVGDGKWISKDPPEKPAGTYDSREFEVEIGIEATGTGDTRNFIGTTVIPVESPEQQILSLKIEKNGFDADVQELSSGAARLVVGGSISKGQTFSATAKYLLKISKSYHGYSTDNLSHETRFSTRHFGAWLGNSPGIQTHSKTVNTIAEDLSNGIEHPLEKIQKFQKWVFENIKGKPMKYTSVTQAIKNGIGDCEERAGTFVALCRSIGVPARLVWVPNHAWAECCLLNKEGQPCWIPVHTAAYNWFGWTGAHELVLQKGDRITLPNNRKKVRLVADWLSWQGAKPRVRFIGTVKPVATEESKDAAPGHRIKDGIGRWNLVKTHPDTKYLRR